MAGTALGTMEAVKAAMTIIQMEGDGLGVKQKVIRLRDFFWDRVITTMIFLIFGVTAVQAIVSYFDDGGLRCWTPGNYSIVVTEYIDRLCRKDVPNYGKFYSISLYAEVALLSGFHIFWNQVWSGRIENFKSTVASMSLKRSTTTGDFESSDHEAVRYLERNLESTALTWMYMLKTGGQVTLSALSIAFLVFYPELGFSFAIDPMLVFECNNESLFEGQWPLAEPSINCALTELSNLQILRWFNFSALVIIISANAVGTLFLAYSIYFYHLLDYKRVARFILYTGLRRDHYPEYHYKSGCNREYEMCSNGCTNSCNFLVFSLCWWCKTSKCNICLGRCCCPCGCCDEENFTRGLIPFDMTFLIVRLLGTNTKMGEELLDVLIDNHLDYLVKNECIKINERQATRNNDRHSLGKIVTEASSGLGEHLHCILITNDNESLAYLLDSYGVFDRMVCINFNSVISATEKSEKRRFRHEHTLVYQVPSQVWSVNERMHKEIESHVQKVVKDLYGRYNQSTVIVLAPLSDEVYIHGDLRNTMQRVKSLLKHIQRIDTVHTSGCENRLYLLSIIPKSIANKADVSSEFCGGDGFQESYDPSYKWKRRVLTHNNVNLDVEGVKYSLSTYESERQNLSETAV